MNFKKRLHFLLLFLLLVPNIVFAYSNNVILGGANLGIRVNTKNVIIVGFYKVDDKYIGEDAGLSIGDSITKFTEAMKLAETCDKKLKNAEEQISKIVTKNGKLEDFEIEE